MAHLPHSCTVTVLFQVSRSFAFLYMIIILLASSCFASNHNFSSLNLTWYTTLTPIWLEYTVACDELDHECALPPLQHAVQRLWVPQVMLCSWWWQGHWWTSFSQIQHWSVTRWDLPWQELAGMDSDWFPLQASVGAQHESHLSPLLHHSHKHWALASTWLSHDALNFVDPWGIVNVNILKDHQQHKTY